MSTSPSTSSTNPTIPNNPYNIFNNDTSLLTSTNNCTIPPKKIYKVGDFIIQHKLGEGSYGKVFLATHKATNQKAAVKILEKSKILNNSMITFVEKEIRIHKKLHHESILQHYCVIETHQTITMVNEYCSNGDLFNYIFNGKNTKVNEVDACRLIFQLLNGLDYLHKQNITHRDIKLDNLLLTDCNQLKIADFGFSTYTNSSSIGIDNLLKTQCGSLCYSAPEIIKGNKYNGANVDLWSCGVVLYALITGTLPFNDHNQVTLINKITTGNYNPIPSYVSTKCKEVIKGLLTVDPYNRFTIKQLRKHCWFNLLNNSMRTIVSPGIFIEEDIIPFDKSILYAIKEDQGFTADHIINSILMNSHNEITTAYYLQLMAWVKKGIKSVSDISSSSELFMRYIERDIAKVKYFDGDLRKAVQWYQNELKNDEIMYGINTNSEIGSIEEMFNDKKPMSINGRKREKMRIQLEDKSSAIKSTVQLQKVLGYKKAVKCIEKNDNKSTVNYCSNIGLNEKNIPIPSLKCKMIENRIDNKTIDSTINNCRLPVSIENEKKKNCTAYLIENVKKLFDIKRPKSNAIDSDYRNNEIQKKEKTKKDLFNVIKDKDKDEDEEEVKIFMNNKDFSDLNIQSAPLIKDDIINIVSSFDKISLNDKQNTQDNKEISFSFDHNKNNSSLISVFTTSTILLPLTEINYNELDLL